MKISILTPSFNTGKYIERAIKSVQAQRYTDWEHIVADGGSTDNTLNILESYPHLIWSSNKDKGQSDAMNKAFAQASGDLIIYLNADDELKPDALYDFIQAFEKNQQADMIVANLEINYRGKKSINAPSISLKQVLNYWPCIFPANPVSYAYRKKFQQRIGRFPVDNHYTMDYWFLLRAFLTGSIIKVEFIAGTFFFDGTNKSADSENARKWLQKVRNQFLIKYFYHPQVARFIVRKLLKH